MGNMPELRHAGEYRTGETSQSVEEDPIDADARQKAKSVHAENLRADDPSG